ncbi:hypothetical protein N7520_002368 [Penicillium odoratum]|uniref:uncharacterized protein n=1 Tax=Penicillium odoratum TaxID=1167516 RepID=UPI0025497837|nr:uncharacterized protein N7520_002368 [Penicillium odoratum]KAJ5771839.1 hypothetical protein N7520_002368 [Penicillium odoratum]
MDTNDPYGQGAYRALWGTATCTDQLPFTTTVSPFPVASSELVSPPIYDPGQQDRHGSLPADFMWGVAGSAWQYDGGLMDQGRGPSSADSLGLAAGGNDSIVADMHYYLYKQDILRLAAIGILYYFFSIAWSRVVPFGVAGSPINMQALDHYEDIINFCIENGIVPVVTLTHIVTPATLVTGEKALIGYQHTDRVPVWITFNEPNIMTDTFHGYHNVLMAHARVWHFYHEELSATGKISMKIFNNFAFSLRFSNPDDLVAAQWSNEFSLGILLNPMVRGVDYPESVKNTTGANVTQLKTKDLSYLNETVDFLAIDAYSQIFTTPPDGGIEAYYDANGWLIGSPSTVYKYTTPTYVRPALKYYDDVYHTSGGTVITEFGWNALLEANMTPDEARYDDLRSQYYTYYIANMVKSIDEDGVPIVGAFAWSLIDNNEWGTYAQRYDMQTVDRNTQLWRFKRSMFDYVDAFQKLVKGHR